MKRAAEDPDDAHKRLKSSLGFLTTGLSTVRFLSDKTTWRAAKALVASVRVEVSCIKQCSDTSTLCIQGTVTAQPSGSDKASVPHTCSTSGQTRVQLLMDTRSGELLDADTSCCPGGYHAARGSFCPCVGALLLAAAQLHSLEHGQRQEMDLHTWHGIDAISQQQQIAQGAGKQYLLQQAGLVQQAPPGLMEELAQVKAPDGSTHRVRFLDDEAAFHRAYYAQRQQVPASGDLLHSLLVPPHQSILSQHLLLQSEGCCLPGYRQNPGNGIHPRVQRSASPDAQRPDSPAGNHLQRSISALGAVHLTSYMGKEVPGWYQRPKVINWAFSLLISAVGSAGNPPAASSSNSSNTVLQTANGQALVALTGLLQVLWHHIHVAGIPAGLRDLLLVAMALRNLLLAVALPVWARKAVAAQLRAWQEAISEAQATLPLVVEDDARVVHLLRVLGEAEQLCYHGWEHPVLQAAMQPQPAPDSVPGDLCQQLRQLDRQPLPERFETPGLLLLRLVYLDKVGDGPSHTRLAVAARQWDHAIHDLLCSGDRSQLQLAAEMLPRHISALPRRLDYMQQLLGLEELGVVERCELAARLLLSIRGDLVPAGEAPVVAASPEPAWWNVQVWRLPASEEQTRDRSGPGHWPQLQEKLRCFLEAFLRLAAKAQFDLAKASIAAAAAASAAGSDASGLDDMDLAGPQAACTIETAALQQRHDTAGNAASARNSLLEGPGTTGTLNPPQGHPRLGRLLGSPIRGPVSPGSPLELDESVWKHGEPSERPRRMPKQQLQLDPLGFVDQDPHQQSAVQVEPFPLPDLLPICGLAPAGLHAAVEGALAPLVDAAFRPGFSARGSTRSSGSHPDGLTATLLHVAGHPGVEHGGEAVRLQMAVEMVAYCVAMTPLSIGRDTLKSVYRPLLQGLCAMGQQGLAWVVAHAAYRVCPGRFTATYLLLLAIQRGTEAQAAAVDWILARDWPQEAAARPMAGPWPPPEEPGPDQHQGAPATAADSDSSSIDTQQLLGSRAAQASVMRDTASSSNPRQATVEQQGTPAMARSSSQQQQQVPQLGIAELVASCMACLEGYQPSPGGPQDLTSFVQALRQASAQDHSTDGLACSCTEDALLYCVREVLHRSQEALPLLKIMAACNAIQQLELGAIGEGSNRSQLTQQLCDTGLAAAAAAAKGRSTLPHHVHMRALEWDLLGVTGFEWQRRTSQLCTFGLPAAVAFCASTGLHPDLVAHLGVVLLGAGPPGAEYSPPTWGEWFETMNMERDLQMDPYHLTMPYPSDAGAPLLYRPPRVRLCCSIQELAGDPYVADTDFGLPHPYGLGPWLLHFLQATRAEATPSGGTASSSSSSSSGAATAAGPAQVHLLRQLWVLHQDRCYSPWFIWLATALARGGEEQQVVAEAAAQGLLPYACSFWNIPRVTSCEVNCLQGLLPHLEASGNQEVLHHLPATQLLLLHQPVARHLLMKPGMLQSLLELWRNVAACYIDEHGECNGQLMYGCLVPSSSWSMADGSLQLEEECVPGALQEVVVPLHTLIKEHVLAPLASALPPAAPTTTADGLPPLTAQALPQEEELVTLLSDAMVGAGLSWREQLYLCRCAREAGLIRSWPSLAALLSTPLLDGALAHHAAVADAWTQVATAWPQGVPQGPPGTLEEWRGAPYADVSDELLEVNTRVSGCVSWLVAEVNKVDASGVPEEPLEQLSSSLSTFCAPHMLLYAAAVARATGASLSEGFLCQLMCNGLMPRSAWAISIKAVAPVAWCQPQYLHQLRTLLQSGELLSALPAGTSKELAVTYALQCGSMRELLAANELLYAVDPPHANDTAAEGGSDGDTGTAEAELGGEGRRANVVLGMRAAAGAAGQAPGGCMGVDADGWVHIHFHPDLRPLLHKQHVPVDEAFEVFEDLREQAEDQDMRCALRAVWGPSVTSTGPLDQADFGGDSPNSVVPLQWPQHVFDLVDAAERWGAPFTRWLEQDTDYSSSRELLRGPLGRPAAELDALVSAITYPRLQLRVLQVLIWQLSKDIMEGAPGHVLRLSKGPAAPWDHKSTAAVPCAATPSYVACSSSWEQLPDAELAALYAAACRALDPVPQQNQEQQPAAPVSKAEQAATVARWLEAQEVALAWAVVKYAELRGHMPTVLKELPALTLADTDRPRSRPKLGRLPVFTTQLGAAVKEDWELYPLYALFFRTRLEFDVYEYVWRTQPTPTQQQLEQYLDRRFNRVAVQQLCVGAFPWLDWIGADKAAEVGQLATWLRWLSVQRWGQPGVAEHARLQPLQPRNYFEEFLEGFAEPQEPPGEGGQPDDDIDLDSVSEDSDDWAAPAADRQQLWGAHEEALLEQLLAADAGEMMQQEDVEWM